MTRKPLSWGLRLSLGHAVPKWIKALACKCKTLHALPAVTPGYAYARRTPNSKYRWLWLVALRTLRALPLPFGLLSKDRFESQTPVARLPSCKVAQRNNIETRQVLDLPAPTLAEVIQVICDSWERGLKENVPFRELIRKLLAEAEGAGAGAGGEVEGNVLGEHGPLDNPWQVCTQCFQAQGVVDSEDVGRGSCSSLTERSWEGSDASSTVYSEYTVRSTTSLNERTNWFFRPRGSHWQQAREMGP